MQRTYRPSLGIELPPMQSGRYYRVPNGSITTATVTAGTLSATPKFVPSTVSIDRLGMEVSTAGDAGSKVRLGIYADDGTLRPGALVLDAGTINGDSNTRQDITVSATLQRGWYWFAAANQIVTTVTPVWRTLSIVAEVMPLDATTTQPASSAGVFGFTIAGVTGALPATFGTPSRSSTAVALWVRVA